MFDKLIIKQTKRYHYDNLEDYELQGRFHEFPRKKVGGSDLAIRIALVKEIIKRTTGLELFDVQILGALKLLSGSVVEMKTGEGKTIVAVLASLLRYLEGGRTHVITVNDYLAERDGTYAKVVYDFLNLKAEFIISSEMEGRREKYNTADVLYITNSELGFDYLRSNGAYTEKEIVFNIDNALAIVDEADSILIDEAKIPLILSARKELQMNEYKRVDAFVRTIKNNQKMYEVDLKDRQCFLTAEGCKKAEKYFKLDDYTTDENSELRHLITQSMAAHFIMQKDKEYIVYKGEVKLVDQSTGRIAEGRRFNRGLHQAIEAKEKVEIKPENATVATITYQNLFKMYDKLSGMTGTAYSERKEFKEIYHLNVDKIPTNKPIARIDQKDLIFSSNTSRAEYFVNYVKEEHAKNRPILIGTNSIEQSEIVANLLKKNGIKPQVLNAKNHELEAGIIAHAGEQGVVTVATSMAGRGTDIKLGDGVRELGGLLIIGMGHYNNVRIDNQLRGRSGRQGDPGESIFLVSLEDDLVKIFANEMLMNLMKSLNESNNGQPITNAGFQKAVGRAQYQIQIQTFNQRKSTIEYDEVLGKYRDLYYAERMNILLTEDLGEIIRKIIGVEGQVTVEGDAELIIKQQMLLAMDSYWMDFLSISEDLRNEASYESYTGTKPIVVYETKLAEYYAELLKNIRIRITNMFPTDITKKEL